MNHPQRIVLLIVLLAVSVAVFLFLRPNTPRPDDGVVSVVASFYPLAEFTRQVGGDLIRVETLTPAGVEPHDFEPAPRDIAKAYEADLFLFNGGGVDAWASRLAPSLAQQEIRVLEISPFMGSATLPPLKEEHSEEEEEGHEEELFDEHFWLSPTLAQKQVEVIRDTLMAIDEAHAETYRKNAAQYILELQALDEAYATGLAVCATRTAVTSHAAFAYLAHDYGFEQVAIAGLSPDEEPSARALAEVAEEAKRRGVEYIFFETLVSPELAETVAREVGAKTLVFNPLEGLTEEEMTDGKTYLSVMEENLQNLRTAMVCR